MKSNKSSEKKAELERWLEWAERKADEMDPLGRGWLGPTGPSYDYLTIKYLANGDTAWVRRWDGPGNRESRAFALALDQQGNCYVTGAADERPNAIQVFNIATVKYSSSGNQQWSALYSANHIYDAAIAAGIDGAGNLYVTGLSDTLYPQLSIITLEYSLGTGVETSGEQVPREFELGQNYPNPFNPSTKIRFSVPQASTVALKVYNLLGQEVATLVNEVMKVGRHEVEFNASTLSSGVYLYRIVSNGYTSTRKLILLK